MSTQIPRVSVLLPARNAETSLATCLRSLQRQTLEDWECVLVEDGSGDRTGTVAREAAARDSRIRVLATPGLGIVGALRAGLERCRAALVARMDADDWMHRGRLAAQCGALAAEPALAAVGCHVRLFPRRGLSDGARAYERWLNAVDSERGVRLEAFVECPIAHPSLVIRRPLLEQFGYRDTAWAEDYDLVLRLLADGRRIGVVPRRLLGWRHAEPRLSRSDPRYGLERFTACKAHHLARGFLADGPDYTLWGYGDTGRSLRKALAEHGKHPAWIVELHPGRLGQTIHGAPVVGPDALPDLPYRPLVVSVAGAGPRAKIRDALAQMGFEELRDFVVAA